MITPSRPLHAGQTGRPFYAQVTPVLTTIRAFGLSRESSFKPAGQVKDYMTVTAQVALQPPAIASGFVRKLYRILDQESAAIISWDGSGTFFSIYDHARLNDVVLPRYFRGRLCAFHQQLLDHGFEQISNQNDIPSYRHACFLRGDPAKLSCITRIPQPRRRRRSTGLLLQRRKENDAARNRQAAVKTESIVTGSPSLKRSAVKAGILDTHADSKRAEPPSAPQKPLNPLFTDGEEGWDLSWMHEQGTVSASKAFDHDSPRCPSELLMPATEPLGCSAPSEISFSEDMLAELLNLSNEPKPAPEVTGHFNKLCNIYTAQISPLLEAAKTREQGLVESHQFSDETIDLLLRWVDTK